ncbi:MAG: SDR family oxidoreductase [Thermodesulfobacteriota bacterium]
MVVTLSPIVGIIGAGALPAYHTSKWGRRILAKTAAIQYAKENIRVHAVHPGGVIRRFWRRSARKRTVTRVYPVGYITSAEEIAW